MLEALYILGAIASVIGAIVSWLQSKKARSARRAIENYRDRLGIVQSNTAIQQAYDLCNQLSQVILPYKSKVGFEGIEKHKVPELCGELRNKFRSLQELVVAVGGDAVGIRFDSERVDTHIEGLESSRRVEESIRWIKELARDVQAVEATILKLLQDSKTAVEQVVVSSSLN